MKNVENGRKNFVHMKFKPSTALCQNAYEAMLNAVIYNRVIYHTWIFHTIQGMNNN